MLIFAHRGASGYQPENTLIAMQAALDMNVQAIELDVHNVEGQLVVFHDRRLEGKSNGKGLIRQLSFSDLPKLSVKQQPIPTLWQVLELINGRCMVNIELKGDDTASALINLYPKIFTQLKFTHQQILISSFNHPYLAQIKQTCADAYVAPLLGGIPLDLAKCVTDLNAYSVHLDLSFVSKALIDDAHQRGAKVYVYTVDNADDIRALQSIGVDGVFSNYPDKALQALKGNHKDYSDWFE
ncbi:glycerophosphodiester phosphodiesterase [Shewanella gaetbuli]|uniref:Glycerophosphodiester phosphodiesterase n=1 Tax=Shewanella gaetbuli TaxID=220752 RepID=A0A9X2CL21_9GAMM|nr:glycerophosphodiester phosphodiesterase family protein [Shewanella gaetbuli]MCL1142235.1 glycerophosphodiester phosphodiesterase [Shewanella gaetbuli]